MTTYDALKSKDLYERYLVTEDPKLLPELLASTEGLIDSIIYSKFSGYDSHIQEDYRQDARMCLMTIFREKLVKLDGNYTSFLAGAIYRTILNKLRHYHPKEIHFEDIQGPDRIGSGDETSRKIQDTIDADYACYIRHEICRLYRLYNYPEWRPVCKFVCHYYVSKKKYPSFELVKKKFKLPRIYTGYAKVLIYMRGKLKEFKLRYLKGED